MTQAEYPRVPAVLRVHSLRVSYGTKDNRSTPALRGVQVEIGGGEIVGILGESGSGKSTLALAMLGLLPRSAQVDGSVVFQDKELLKLDEPGWRAIRGARIAIIFQEPGITLSPVMRVGDQIAEVIRAHQNEDSTRRKQRVRELLRAVGLPEVDRIYSSFAHQLSGGELHRIAIAQALACKPDVVIADEPTRSLDAALQADILNLLRESSRKLGSSLIFITHNPALLARFADRIIVLYAGHVVEEGPTAEVFRHPLHPYTQGLLRLVPVSLHHVLARGERLAVIPGSMADVDLAAPGCAFAARCFARTSICDQQFPHEVVLTEHRRVSCFNYGD